MDQARARTLLERERRRVESLLAERSDARRDALPGEEHADTADSAEPLVEEGADDAVIAQLRRELEAIDRAEGRLAAGTYGRSVRSGEVIPDERLEAEPTAELTVAEAGGDGPGRP